jgi:hypothetical protein
MLLMSSRPDGGYEQENFGQPSNQIRRLSVSISKAQGDAPFLHQTAICRLDFLGVDMRQTPINL